MQPRAVDAAGVAHEIGGAGTRIVSLVPSITELLFALGLDRQIVGRTGFCVHPRDKVRQVRKVGGTKSVNVDAIRALRPTHLIVNIDENERDTVEQLRAFVPHIVVTHPQTPQDNLSLYALLGAIFDREQEAQRLSEALEIRLHEAAAHVFPEQNVLYLIWREPWMTVARDTYIAAMLQARELADAARRGRRRGRRRALSRARLRPRAVACRRRSHTALQRALSLHTSPLRRAEA